MNRYIGLRVNKNIYSRQGTLLVPGFTTLTRKHIELLLNQNIVLCDDDVEHPSIIHLVDSSIREIKRVFAKVYDAKQIPCDDIRDKIIPIIDEMSRHSELIHIFAQFERNDEYTYRHSIGVALIARLIGKAKGIHAHELQELTESGLLHDIGKVKIPVELMNKPGKLTKEEFDQIKRHTIYGYELINHSKGISHRQAIVALQHHEREDGSGYPYGLRGNQIDSFSKIIAIADVFHAMVSKRVYKDPMPLCEVLQEMSHNAYGSLEPSTTLYFVKRIMDMMIGNRVILSNGHRGKIIMVSPNDPVNPLVEVNGRYIDLSKEPDVKLERII